MRRPSEPDYSQVDDRPVAIRERCRTGVTLLLIQSENPDTKHRILTHYSARPHMAQVSVSHVHQNYPFAVEHINSVGTGTTALTSSPSGERDHVCCIL